MLFHTNILNFILHLFVNIFLPKELPNAVNTLPLGGQFKLMMSTIVMLLLLFLSPLFALLVLQKKSKVTPQRLFFVLSTYTIVIAGLTILSYYLYFVTQIAQQIKSPFSLLQIPIMELGVSTFIIVFISAIIFSTKKQNGIAGQYHSTNKEDH